MDGFFRKIYKWVLRGKKTQEIRKFAMFVYLHEVVFSTFFTAIKISWRRDL